MQDDKNLSKIDIQDQHIMENKELSLTEAFIPVVILMGFLAYNIFAADGEMFGEYSNHYILLIGGLVSAFVGFYNRVSIIRMFLEIWENWRSIMVPLFILLLVGALAGTWLISGVIPAMVYYGLQVLSPAIFLPASVIIAAIISIATGSSWTTSATVGIALIGIGSALGIPTGMIAGAVISGAYFGDKMSPLSDTTNLAPAMAGTDLFTHIKYMAYTTVPTILVTLTAFTIMSFTIDTSGNADVSDLLGSIDKTFYISPWLFLVPAAVVGMILLKTKPLIALGVGVVLAAIFALIFQTDVLATLSSSNTESVLNAVFSSTQITTDNETLTQLFNAGGMGGMTWTILLVVCAMVFGGVMDAIGALAKLTKALLSLASSIFGLFASTVVSCLGLNVIASDQYLALVIPGKMFKKAYEDKGLAPENLSRTLEDSGTVTSVLIPWNTCGAYQSGVLGVGVGEYFFYAIFNWLSPFMTLIFAAFRIKIRQLAAK
tara:strand:+ start:20077 stop:21543 length:1467 start_codon:yes stop_codon:yes gene_type:complete